MKRVVSKIEWKKESYYSPIDFDEFLLKWPIGKNTGEIDGRPVYEYDSWSNSSVFRQLFKESIVDKSSNYPSISWAK